MSSNFIHSNGIDIHYLDHPGPEPPIVLLPGLTADAAIVIEPTDDLIRFQKKLIDAVAPFTEKTGTAAAFVTTAESPDINQPTIDYVNTYVPDHTGQNFNPHVTIGIASQDYLKKLLDEKFEAFTFSPVGVSVYHLGNFGTAKKKLKSWELKP